MRPRATRTALCAAAVSLAASPLACSSGHPHKPIAEPHQATSHEQPSGERDDADRRPQLDKIPTVDRQAFIELATASGTLRAAGAPIALGRTAQRASLQALAVTQPRIAALRPRDPTLRQTRSLLLAALVKARGLRQKSPTRADGRRAIRDTDRLNRALRSYAQTHPAVGGLVPD